MVDQQLLGGKLKGMGLPGGEGIFVGKMFQPCHKGVEIKAPALDVKGVGADLLEEGPGALPPGRVEDLLRGTVLVDLPLIHIEDPGGHVPGKLHLVGDDHHGHPLLGQAADDPQHLGHHGGVQGGGGLVKQHDLRVHRQGPGDGHALLLPAGQRGVIQGKGKGIGVGPEQLRDQPQAGGLAHDIPGHRLVRDHGVHLPRQQGRDNVGLGVEVGHLGLGQALQRHLVEDRPGGHPQPLPVQRVQLALGCGLAGPRHLKGVQIRLGSHRLLHHGLCSNGQDKFGQAVFRAVVRPVVGIAQPGPGVAVLAVGRGCVVRKPAPIPVLPGQFLRHGVGGHVRVKGGAQQLLRLYGSGVLHRLGIALLRLRRPRRPGGDTEQGRRQGEAQPSASAIFPQGQDVVVVLVGVFHAVHGFLHHEDAKPPDTPFLGG